MALPAEPTPSPAASRPVRVKRGQHPTPTALTPFQRWAWRTFGALARTRAPNIFQAQRWNAGSVEGIGCWPRFRRTERTAPPVSPLAPTAGTATYASFGEAGPGRIRAMTSFGSL